MTLHYRSSFEKTYLNNFTFGITGRENNPDALHLIPSALYLTVSFKYNKPYRFIKNMARNVQKKYRRGFWLHRIHFVESTGGEIRLASKICHFFYPTGKPRMLHLLRCQGFAVAHYGFTLAALHLQHPRLLQR